MLPVAQVVAFVSRQPLRERESWQPGPLLDELLEILLAALTPHDCKSL